MLDFDVGAGVYAAESQAFAVDQQAEHPVGAEAHEVALDQDFGAVFGMAPRGTGAGQRGDGQLQQVFALGDDRPGHVSVAPRRQAMRADFLSKPIPGASGSGIRPPSTLVSSAKPPKGAKTSG